MANRILSQLEKIIAVYDTLIQVTDEVFLSLKLKDFQRLQELNKKEIDLSLLLKKEMNHLIEKIKEFCAEHHIQEPKIVHALKVVSVEEREQILACQKQAMQSESKFKNNVMLNRSYIEAMMGTGEMLIESWVKASQETNAGGSTFLNEKL